MYTDDYSDKESEYEDRSPEESPNVTKKSLSTVGFRGVEKSCGRPLALRATQSLTGAAEELRLCGSVQRVQLRGRGGGPCPCGCLLRAAEPAPFRTRDRNTLALLVVPPDVLGHHGHTHSPAQIAMFWKKDCRMFLWKGKARIKSPAYSDPLRKIE